MIAKPPREWGDNPRTSFPPTSEPAMSAPKLQPSAPKLSKTTHKPTGLAVKTSKTDVSRSKTKVVSTEDAYSKAFQHTEKHTKNLSVKAGDQTFSAAKSTGNAKLPASLASLLGNLPTQEIASGTFSEKVAVRSGQGSFDTGHVQGNGSFDALYAYAKGSGSATVGADGLKAKGEVAAGAGLLEAEGTLKAGYGPIEAELSGKGFVGAKANAAGELTIDPVKGVYVAQVGGQAFAGAKAGVEGTVGLGEFGKVGGNAEVWAGIGVKANATLGLQNNRLKFKFELGAALGIGAKFGVNLDINLAPVTKAVERGVYLAVDTLKATAHPVKTFKRLLHSVFG